MSHFEPEVEPMETRLYEVYLNYCTQNNEVPSIKDYLVWLSDRYDYEPKFSDTPEPVIPNDVYIEAKIEEAERLRDGLREDGVVV